LVGAHSLDIAPAQRGLDYEFQDVVRMGTDSRPLFTDRTDDKTASALGWDIASFIVNWPKCVHDLALP
jgi:hypothetical protein